MLNLSLHNGLLQKYKFEFNINSWEYEFIKSYFLADRVLLQMQMLGFETRMQNAEFRRAETWI